jgi:bifunctional non-homologous end joining protein LigD
MPTLIVRGSVLRSSFLRPYEQGQIGPELFTAACRMGLEGLISKHKERAYRGGPCPHWIKVKNAKAPAMHRSKERVKSRARG